MNKKIFILISSISLQITSMQVSQKDALLKYALLEFVKTSNLSALNHFIAKGQANLIDKEIADQAKAAYEANKKNSKGSIGQWNHPASQIYYMIESITGPMAEAQK